MLKRLLIVIGLLLVREPLNAQLASREHANQLISQLKKSQPDTNTVIRLIQLGKRHILKPGEQRADLDSALLIIRQAESLSKALNYPKGLGNSYWLLAQAFREKGEKERGKSFSHKAIALFTHYNYQNELGETYQELSQSYSLSDKDLPERIRIITQALTAYQRVGNKKKEADTFKERGDLQYLSGNYSQSLAELRQALALYKSIHYPALHGVYDLLGASSSAAGDFKEGIQYGLLAVQTGELLNDTTLQMSTIYNRLGISYFEIKEYRKADIFFRKALVVAETYKDLSSVYIMALNISNGLLRLNRPQEALLLLQTILKRYPSMDIDSRIRMMASFITIYVTLKRYKQGNYYCDQLIKLAAKAELGEELRRVIYLSVVKYFFATRQYQKAHYYLEAHQAIAEQTGLKAGLSVSNLWRFRLDSARGNYLSAVKHFQHYKAQEDSMFNESKSNQISRLELRYETAKKDQAIKLKEQNIQLLIKQAQLQQTKLQQATFGRNITFAGIVLLCLILGLFYNRYQLKQQSNQQLQAQQAEINQKNRDLEQLLNGQNKLIQEKEWLLKEVHHRVKNNLQVIISLLNVQSAYLDNEAAVRAIRYSQHRMQAISLIHQQLYQWDNVASIDMPSYISELVNYLQESFDTRQRIYFNLQIESLKLDVAQAVPLGLTLNEAITNAIKYAFPEQEKGQITVSLQRTAENNVLLTIADNGVGLPISFDIHQSESLGFSLMEGFSQQFDGSFQVKNHKGVKISITFKEETQVDKDEQA